MTPGLSGALRQRLRTTPDDTKQRPRRALFVDASWNGDLFEATLPFESFTPTSDMPADWDRLPKVLAGRFRIDTKDLRDTLSDVPPAVLDNIIEPFAFSSRHPATKEFESWTKVDKSSLKGQGWTPLTSHVGTVSSLRMGTCVMVAVPGTDHALPAHVCGLDRKTGMPLVACAWDPSDRFEDSTRLDDGEYTFPLTESTQVHLSTRDSPHAQEIADMLTPGLRLLVSDKATGSTQPARVVSCDTSYVQNEKTGKWAVSDDSRVTLQIGDGVPQERTLKEWNIDDRSGTNWSIMMAPISFAHDARAGAAKLWNKFEKHWIRGQQIVVLGSSAEAVQVFQMNRYSSPVNPVLYALSGDNHCEAYRVPSSDLLIKGTEQVLPTLSFLEGASGYAYTVPFSKLYPPDVLPTPAPEQALEPESASEPEHAPSWVPPSRTEAGSTGETATGETART